jgi:hypothetical protein
MFRGRPFVTIITTGAKRPKARRAVRGRRWGSQTSSAEGAKQSPSCGWRIWRDDVDQPYFWPRYLGEKGQLFDFLVELVGAGEKTPFFFVQVRSTRKDFTRQVPPRLRVEVSQTEVRRMVAYPAPTYVVGVHEVQERAFAIAVHGAMGEAIASITTAHELDGETLRRLWQEVRDFWQGRDMTRPVSSFLNEVSP